MAKKIKREELLDLMKYYEQAFFTHDLPIYFKQDLIIYPILVKDYYKFYSCISCFKINKNEDMVGIGKSDLGYIIYLCKDEEKGPQIFSQFIQLIEMIFHIENGFYCPVCKNIIPFSEVSQNIKKYQNIPDSESEYKKELINKYLKSVYICDECTKNEGHDIHRIESIKFDKDEKNKDILKINDVPINSSEYDILRNIVLYYNIPDYDDEYIDPELKKDLEEVARLKNPNNVQPSLEKQESCIISACSAYTYETIKEISIRKLVILLRTIDAQLHYFAYRQAEASGFVTFKNELTHWIYGVDKKDKFADVMTMDALRDKLKDVT